MITSEAEAEQVRVNLARVTANLERAEGLHERVKAEPRRLIRNRRRLAESRALIAENAALQAQNASILGTGRSAMTDITDTEAAEVLWASSEQGKAAVRAGWERALRLGLGRGGRMLWDIADISAIVYAAYLAAGWDAEPMEDDEPAPAHDHQWTILGAQPHTPTVIFGKPVPHTIVLMRCTECGEPDSRMLPGEWALHELQEDPA